MSDETKTGAPQPPSVTEAAGERSEPRPDAASPAQVGVPQVAKRRGRPPRADIVGGASEHAEIEAIQIENLRLKQLIVETGQKDASLPSFVGRRWPPKLAAAMGRVARKVRVLGTDTTNPFGKYPYVSIGKFDDHVGGWMSAEGVMPIMNLVESRIASSDRSGSNWMFSRWEIRLLHESGEISEPLYRDMGIPISGPQAYGSSQTYVRKEFLRATFQIPTGEKDEVDSLADDHKDVPKVEMQKPAAAVPSGLPARAEAAGPKSPPPPNKPSDHPNVGKARSIVSDLQKQLRQVRTLYALEEVELRFELEMKWLADEGHPPEWSQAAIDALNRKREEVGKSGEDIRI